MTMPVSSRIRGCTAVLLVFFQSAGCRPQIIEGEPPVSHFEVRGRWVHVRTEAGTTLDQLTNLACLEGIRPMAEIDDARIALGEPRRIISPRTGQRFRVYEKACGTIWIGSEQVTDGTIHPLVVYFPSSRSITSVLRPAVAAGIPTAPSDLNANIYLGADRLPAARVQIVDNVVDRVLLFGEDLEGRQIEEPARFPG